MHRLEIETHATLLSWSTWLAAWVMGASTQRHNITLQHPANTKSRSLGLHV